MVQFVNKIINCILFFDFLQFRVEYERVGGGGVVGGVVSPDVNKGGVPPSRCFYA